MRNKWRPIAIAPRSGRPVLARRHNGVSYEYDVIWWSGQFPRYPWISRDTSYAIDRMDDWLSIPGEKISDYKPR